MKNNFELNDIIEETSLKLYALGAMVQACADYSRRVGPIEPPEAESMIAAIIEDNLRQIADKLTGAIDN